MGLIYLPTFSWLIFMVHYVGIKYTIYIYMDGMGYRKNCPDQWKTTCIFQFIWGPKASPPKSHLLRFHIF